MPDINSQEELVQRWDSFLLKISLRFNESLKHAEEACVDQLIKTDYEYETVFRAWQGMKAQIRNLIGKIDTVWDESVQPEMESLGDFWTDEMGKGPLLNDRLEDELGSFQRKLEGKLSQLFYDHAIQLANKKASCSQCDASIEIRKDIFRAQYITCGYCNTVNTIAPETKYLKIGWGVVDNIAAARTQQLYETKRNAEEAIRAARNQVSGSLWSSYKTAYFNYWEAFFLERIKLNSEAGERYEEDMGRKRKEFENFQKIQRS